MTKLIIISLLFSLLPFGCAAQPKENWITASRDQWPQIALENHVQYNNGDRYIDPSLSFAGNGFLIETGNDTLAATAKHVLWVAKNRRTKTVQLNRDLMSWIMKPEGINQDSVVIDRLINEDSTEILEGGLSSILERDWLLFTVKNTPSRIQPLKLRHTAVMPGETVFIVGYSYSEPVQQIHEGKILQKLGMDILIEQNVGTPLPGASGSPVIDVNGFLIGILSSVTTDPGTGKNVAVAVSTEYAKDVLRHKGNFNAPKKDYGGLILQTVLKRGARQAIRQYTALTNNAENYYVYNLRSANRNGLREAGEKLMNLKRYQDAVDILKFNVKINPLYYVDYNLLAKAWLLSGNKEEAIKNLRISTTMYDDREENEAFKELEKLGVTK
jgi:hypothetical protein